MNVVGLITEYNPFHNGHLYHLNTAKRLCRADAVIAVMSGSFVQRGEPALFSKWTRAEMAISQGVDLVLELPVAYATRSAEAFAFGAVAMLHHTGLVTHLCFGSESGHLPTLKLLAQLFADEPDAYKQLLHQHLKQGHSFAKARLLAVVEFCLNNKIKLDLQEVTETLTRPNNILGLEYLKALHRLNSPLQALTLERLGAAYHEKQLGPSKLASATALRKQLERDPLGDITSYVPTACTTIIKRAREQKQGPIYTNALMPFIRYKLISSSPEELACLVDVSEGLHFRLLKAKHEVSYQGLVTSLTSKRYPSTRIQRLLLHLLLRYTQTLADSFDQAGGPRYLRVLAASSTGLKLIKALKLKSSLPIVNKFATFYTQTDDQLTKSMLDLDVLSTNLFSLLTQQKTQLDFTISPIITKTT